MNKAINKELHTVAWTDLMEVWAKVGGPKFQKLAVNKFYAKRQLGEAAFWFKQFKLPMDQCPAELKQRINTTDSGKFERIGCTPEQAKFYSLRPEQKLKFVDNNAVFDEMLAELTDVKEVGFDCEFESHKLAMLQLAAGTQIYIIDGLTEAIESDRWNAFAEKILNDPTVLKIGEWSFGGAEDGRSLAKKME